MERERTPSWGITPVPERLRTLGALENGMLWASLGLSLLVLVAGAFLVPGALAARGAARDPRRRDLRQRAARASPRRSAPRRGVPAMVLLRAPLGRAGSYLPTGLNVAPEPRLDDLRGARHRDRCAARSCTDRSGCGSSRPPRRRRSSRSLGPIGFVRDWVKRVALWVVLASLAYLTWWALHDAAPRRALVASPGRAGSASGRESTCGRDARLVAPARRRLHALLAGAAAARSGARRVGYFLPNVWLLRARRDPAAARAASRTRPR